MIGYVTLGTNDLPRAAAFYDAIAAHFGVGRMMEFDSFIAWGAWGGTLLPALVLGACAMAPQWMKAAA